MVSFVSDLLKSPETIDQLICWMREAGQMALRHFKNVHPHYKPDQTFLTQADLEIERFLAEQLQIVYPDCHLIGEEGFQDKAGQPSSYYTWVIDPIDGTTVFAQGLPGWGISLGLLCHGQPCFGLFYMPLVDDLTYTTPQGEVYYNHDRLQQTVRPNWGEKGFLAINATAHNDFQISIRRTRALGSIGANLIYTARGVAAGAFIPQAHLWDLVTGAAILAGTGGELRYLSGKAVDYQALLDGRLTPEPIIACHPDLQAELQAAIRPRSSR